MGLETGNEIADLNSNWPLGSDPKAQGDDHIRLIKRVLKNDVYGKDDIDDGFVKKTGDTMTGMLTMPKITGSDGKLDIAASPVVNKDQSGTWPSLIVRAKGDGTGASLAVGTSSVASENWTLTYRGDPDDNLDIRWQDSPVLRMFPSGDLTVIGDLAVAGGDIGIGTLLALNGSGVIPLIRTLTSEYLAFQNSAGSHSHRIYGDGTMPQSLAIPTRASGDGRWAQLGADNIFSGDASFGGAVNVTGAISADSVDVTGAISADSVDVTGALTAASAEVSGTLGVGIVNAAGAVNFGMDNGGGQLFHSGSNLFFDVEGPGNLVFRFDNTATFTMYRDGGANGGGAVMTRATGDVRYLRFDQGLGAIGTYAMIRVGVIGSLVAGDIADAEDNNLEYANAAGGSVGAGAVPANSKWRIMGNVTGDSPSARTTLCMRVS